MATRYVNPDSTAGGDGTTNATAGANRAYVSLNAWEAARQAVLSEVEECICETNGTADTTACVINGWTTTSSNYIDIKTSAGHRHDGKWNTSKYRLDLVGNALTINEEYVRVTGLQAKITSASGAAMRAYWMDVGSPSDVRFESCIAVGVVSGTTTGAARGFLNDGGTATVRNCIAYGFINGAESGHAAFQSWGDVTYQNCTAYNSTTGFLRSLGTQTATNCGAAACSTGFSAAITQTTCSTSTPTFVSTTGGSEDLHLQSGDTTWKDQGTDLSGTFTNDIDGAARSGTWDIGADEVAGGGGGDTNARLVGGDLLHSHLFGRLAA